MGKLDHQDVQNEIDGLPELPEGVAVIAGAVDENKEVGIVALIREQDVGSGLQTVHAEVATILEKTESPSFIQIVSGTEAANEETAEPTVAEVIDEETEQEEKMAA